MMLIEIKSLKVLKVGATDVKVGVLQIRAQRNDIVWRKLFSELKVSDCEKRCNCKLKYLSSAICHKIKSFVVISNHC